MSTISKERLQWLANISGRDDIEDIDGGEIRELARIALASLSAGMEQESVQWGAPKTVKQLIGQLQTLDPYLETTALLRMPADFRDGNAVRQVPLSISYERMDGQWLAPYKSDHRKVLAFWAKPDDRNTAERGEELYTAPPAPVSVPDEMYWQNAPVEGSTRAAAYATGWNACRTAMLQGADGNSPVIPEWQAKAEKMAEIHGSSFVLFRNGESPQCADPTKVIISLTDEGLGHGSAAPQQEVK